MTVVRICHRGAGYNSCKNLVAEVLVMTVVRICHKGAGFVSLNNFVTKVRWGNGLLGQWSIGPMVRWGEGLLGQMVR